MYFAKRLELCNGEGQHCVIYFFLLLQKRCKVWADAGECDANPGFMTNNCKVACKKCTIPVHVPTKKPKAAVPASPANLAAKAVTFAQQAASNASEAAGNLLSTGKEAAASVLSNATAIKDKVIGGSTTDGSKEQNQENSSLLKQAAKTTAVVADEVKQGLAAAANSSRGDSAEDAPVAAGGKQFDDSKVNSAPQPAFQQSFQRNVHIISKTFVNKLLYKAACLILRQSAIDRWTGVVILQG